MSKYDIDPGAIIFDIDGTAANIDHRRDDVDINYCDFPETFKKDWISFYSRMDKDAVVPQILSLCNSYHMNGWDVYFFIGRPEKYREVTTKWLKDKGFMYKELWMRPDEAQYVNDAIIKQNMLTKLNRPVNIVFDDRDRVVKMWRDNNIMCCQVAYGDF